DENTPVQWGQFASSGELRGEVHISPVHQLRQEWFSLQVDAEDDDEPAPDRVVLLLAGNLVFHRNVKINSGQRKHLATALPYLIEEDVAEDIDSFHIARSLDRKQDSVSLSAITHERMQGLLTLFDQCQLPLDQVMAEVQLFEPEPGFTSLLLDSNSVMLAAPGHGSATVDYGAVSFALEGQFTGADDSDLATPVVADEEQQHLSQVKLLVPDGSFAVSTRQVDELAEWLVEQGWLVDKVSLAGSVFEFLAGKYFAVRRLDGLVDLRQGAYQCPRKAGRQWRRWKPLLAAACCWFILELGLSIGEGLLFKHRAKELWSQTMSSYLAVFPQDQQAKSAQANHMMSFNVKRLLENRFKTTGKTQGGEPFLPLLQKISSVSASLGKESGITHQSLDFNGTNGQLAMEFQASSIESVDRFLAELKSSGLNTRLENANQGKEGVTARMTIGR
ncbi:MAG: type II secretion system protein GspL, partial [Endozoicomonas sp.]